jgi:hypothetical protein
MDQKTTFSDWGTFIGVGTVLVDNLTNASQVAIFLTGCRDADTVADVIFKWIFHESSESGLKSLRLHANDTFVATVS